jgi:hypothetical protein
MIRAFQIEMKPSLTFRHVFNLMEACRLLHPQYLILNTSDIENCMILGSGSAAPHNQRIVKDTFFDTCSFQNFLLQVRRPVIC